MKNKIIYKLLTYILIFSTGTIAAQTGVLTHNPQGALHIDSQEDNAATITSIQAANDVVVTTTGNLGVGVLSPVTKVDLRSADQKGIIGVGQNTGQTAAAAGGGAIRYVAGNNPNTPATEVGYLEYSDGEKWIALPLTPPVKALVNANKSSVQNITNTFQDVTDWIKVSGTDTNNDFNYTNGVFTAPRDGFYLVSFNITLASGSIPNNTFIETEILSSQAIDNIQTFRTVNSYPAFQSTTVNNFMSGSCSAIFNLKATNTIKFRARHNMSSGRNTLNQATLNSISISEL